MADAHAHAEHGDDYYVHAHITPARTYVLVLATLLFLTFLTVLAYNVHLGDWNLFVAVLIATIKASIVGTWFMHLKYEQRFNLIFFLGSLFFVIIFLGYTVNDTEHRGRQGTLTGVRVDPATGKRAFGSGSVLQAEGEFIRLPPLPGEAGQAGQEGEADRDGEVPEPEAAGAAAEDGAAPTAAGEPAEAGDSEAPTAGEAAAEAGASPTAPAEAGEEASGATEGTEGTEATEGAEATEGE